MAVMGEIKGTRIQLLYALKEFTEETVRDIILPTSYQKDDGSEGESKATVYLMRLPDSTSAQKKAPYIIHQVITGHDIQQEGQREERKTVVRSIFCVYCSNEQKGGLKLLELMERVQIRMQQKVVIDNVYELDLKESMETLIYPDDTAPYFIGEMVSTWKLPRIKREVPELWH